MIFYVPFSITPQVIRRIPIYTLLFSFSAFSCARGESNPWPDLGRIKYYHYTTSAFSSVDLWGVAPPPKHWRESNPLLRFCRSYHKPLQCLFGVHCDTLPSWWKVLFIPHLPGGGSNPRYNVNSITFYHWTTEYRKVRDLNPRFLSERSFSRRVP